MSGVASLWLAAALLVQPPMALNAVRDRDQLRVTFRLLQQLPEAIETALPSGAVVRIRYPLRVRIPRRVWWDRKIWRGEITATAAFDPVTGRYHCELVLDGVIVSSQEFETAADARQFLAEPGPVVLSLPPIKKTTLKVRVRAVFSSSTKWLLFPSVEGTKWLEVVVTDRPSEIQGADETAD